MPERIYRTNLTVFIAAIVGIILVDMIGNQRLISVVRENRDQIESALQNQQDMKDLLKEQNSLLKGKVVKPTTRRVVKPVEPVEPQEPTEPESNE